MARSASHTLIQHVGRERLSQPHNLANAARTTQQTSDEANGMNLVRQLGIEMILLQQFFTYV